MKLEARKQQVVAEQKNGAVSAIMGSQSRTHLFVGAILLLAILFFVQLNTVVEKGWLDAKNVTVRDHTVSQSLKANSNGGSFGPRGNSKTRTPGASSSNQRCCSRTTIREKTLKGDLLKRKDLLHLAQSAREEMILNIKDDYGDYFEAIFEGPNKTYSPMTPVSAGRLKRKLMIKVLEMQAKAIEKGCNCDENEEITPSTTFAKYVWATGGHSASAGHGNLFNESYTAVLGRDAKAVFQAVGIDFEDRNYAMGGTASGLEISMCWNQVFGTDVDFFSWDYGMTDGRASQLFMHYGYRGGLNGNFPAILGMKVGGRTSRQREQVLKDLELLGMAAFVGSDESYAERNKAVPDSAEGLTQSEIDILPRMVRNYRCGDKLESGEPFCDKDKYSKHTCAIRSKQASWHPGFKSHAMDGHALGLFLTRAMIDALAELVNHPTVDPLQLLAELREEENNQYAQFVNASLPEIKNTIYNPGGKIPPDPSLDLDALWRNPSFCRTGRTPSQTRYLGYATNGPQGGPAIVGQEKYDVGVSFETAREMEAAAGGLPILTYGGGKNERENCKLAIVKPDYKDFFFVSKRYGTAVMSIPNIKEREAYAYDPAKVQGLILLSFVSCDWGKCLTGELRPEDFQEDTFELSVNGKPVKELVAFGSTVWALKGEEGFYWDHNQRGEFDLGISVKKDGKFVRISSVILY